MTPRIPRILSLAAALTLSAAGATLAQPAHGPTADGTAAYAAASSPVGRWLYDLKGNKIGSIRSLSEDGQTAVVMVGSYFQPGSHLTAVPTNALSVVDGKVTLRNETVQALNTALWWR
jgi:hypothetical protein